MAGPWDKYKTANGALAVTIGGDSGNASVSQIDPNPSPSLTPWDRYGKYAEFADRASKMDSLDLAVARSKDDEFGKFLQREALKPRENESEQDSSRRLYGGFTKPDVGMGEGITRSGFQGTSFGAGDEITAAGAAGLDYLTGKTPGKDIGQLYSGYLGNERDKLDAFRGDHPVISTAAEVAGAIPTALAMPGGAVGRAGGLGARMLAGGVEGALAGGVYGFNAGEGGPRNRLLNAGQTAGIGGFVGAAVPVVAAAGKGIYNRLATGSAARDAGMPRPAYELLSNVTAADNAAGKLPNMASDAMIADAGPTTAGLTDALLQKPGAHQGVIRNAIDSRVAAASQRTVGALDDAFGKPGVSSSRALVVYGDKTNPLDLIYKRAYSQPIDYSGDAGTNIRNLVQRVPGRVIKRAQELMNLDGLQSRQILADVADDGSVTYRRLPDVRQLDYITRALNDEAFASAGQGAMGGKTALGSKLGSLARDIRTNLKTAVPDYEHALNQAADAIRSKNAKDFGYTVMSPSVRRDDVSEMIAGMGDAELRKVREGVRMQIDDALANIKTAFTDTDIDGREAAKALKDLSSRTARDKIGMVIGDQEAGKLFDRLDTAMQAFILKAQVNRNSATAGRRMFNKMLDDLVGSGPIERLRRGQLQGAGSEALAAMLGRSQSSIDRVVQENATSLADTLVGPQGPAAINRMADMAAAGQRIPARANSLQSLTEYYGSRAGMAGSGSENRLLMSQPNR